MENYRKKMDPNSDVLSIRKAVYQSYSNESLRQRQRYRHEMAKERRARMESQKLMNLKIKELKEKEKEISRRYSRRNNYGSLIGENKSIKAKFQEQPKNDNSITVLLPVLKKKDGSSRFESSFNEGLDYGAYSIPKKMLPPGKEDISAYEVVKAAQEICTKYKDNFPRELGNDFELENGFSGRESEKDDEDMRPKKTVLTPADKDEILPMTEKPDNGKIKYAVESNVISLPRYRNGVRNRKQLTKQQITSFPKHNFGPSYENLLHVFPYKRDEEDGDRLVNLTVLGKGKKTNTYELLIVDDDSRSEEIRVKQKSRSNPRAFDILIITEKLPKSPNTQ